MVTVAKIGNRWVARCSYEQRAIPKAAGFRWDPVNRVWYTHDEAIAAKIASPEKAEALLRERREAIETSRATDAQVDIPAPDGLEYMPFQRAGIAAALRRQNVLFGDEMGLGKTIQAIGVLNADASLKKVLVVCPASLRLNWKREIEKWLVRPATIGIAVGDHLPIDADIVIVNYDIADRHKAALRAVAWDALIVDEAHYLKNEKAKRTVAILGRRPARGEAGEPGIRARRKIFLTGTPIPNRPVEGWTIFSALAPETFSNFWSYAKRYCAAYNNGYGWDMTGASHLDELQEKLRATIMVRRLKKDVLAELPAKRRAVVVLPANGASKAIEREREAWSRHEATLARLREDVEIAKAGTDEEYEAAVARLRDAARVAFTEMSEVRHETALAKVPYVIEHLRACVEQGEKVVCFAHHRDVIDQICEAFGDAAVRVTGSESMEERQRAVDAFQNDPRVALFVGNIRAAGVGLTLTASSHVVFAELDWVPGNVTQAEDRCHRIGQRNMVLVEHLVLDESIDARMAQAIVEKQKVLDEALDREAVAQEAAVVAVPSEPRVSAARAQIVREAEAMTQEQIAAVHAGLRIVAAFCDGARSLDETGFSKIDQGVGRRLAQLPRLTPRQAALGARLCRKYRRQIPDEILEAIGIGPKNKEKEQ
jgi:SWI/SNF-related matrix-associated actin-dependent regulator 1 of chromatin subfamily A